ncbi:hypothetical protein Q1695_005455 [Nippostrongylus brasiliensis]|nr:hypothetical protein Q1695_005455 [Nippostrongylus brasiliensis]
MDEQYILDIKIVDDKTLHLEACSLTDGNLEEIATVCRSVKYLCLRKNALSFPWHIIAEKFEDLLVLDVRGNRFLQFPVGCSLRMLRQLYVSESCIGVVAPPGNGVGGAELIRQITRTLRQVCPSLLELNYVLLEAERPDDPQLPVFEGADEERREKDRESLEEEQYEEEEEEHFRPLVVEDIDDDGNSTLYWTPECNGREEKGAEMDWLPWRA